MSFGIPLVTAGLTADLADVNARVAWSDVGIDLATNEPTLQALHGAIRTVLDNPNVRSRASLMADEFAEIDTHDPKSSGSSAKPRISDKDGLRRAKSLTSAVWLAPTFPPPPQSVSRRKMKRQNVDAQKAALEPPSFGVHYTRVNELYDSLCLAPRIVDDCDPLANSRLHRRPRPASPERYPLLTSAGRIALQWLKFRVRA